MSDRPASVVTMNQEYPLHEGDEGKAAQIGLCLGGHVKTWTDAGSRLWKVSDESVDTLKEFQGRGVISRTIQSESRFRECGVLFEGSSTLVLQSRFPQEVVEPTDETDGSYTVPTTLIQLEPATDDIGNVADELEALLRQTMDSCIANNEYFAIDQGGWDAPDRPYCLWALTSQDDQTYSILEAMPKPEGSEFWADCGINDAGVYGLGTIATKERLDVVPYLMIDAVRTWGINPLDLTLTLYS